MQSKARLQLLSKQLSLLADSLYASYGNRRVQREVELLGKKRMLEIRDLPLTLRALTAALKADEEGGEGGPSALAPGRLSGALYDRVRRIIRMQEKREAEYEMGRLPSGDEEAWEEDTASNQGDHQEVPLGELLEDLQLPAEPGASVPGDDAVWDRLQQIETWMVENNVGGGGVFDGVDAAQGIENLGPLPREARESIGLDPFGLSQSTYLKRLYCKHGFSTLRQHGLLAHGASCLDVIPDLVRLRKSAFEEYFRADQALRAILQAGGQDSRWGKLYSAVQHVFLGD